MKHDNSTFLSGCAPFYDFIFFAKELDELVKTGQPNSSFFCFDEQHEGEHFCQYNEVVSWPAISMATIKPESSCRHVVAIGPNGDYWEAEPESMQEHVGKITNFNGNLRKLSVIEETIFACGMGRVLLKREALNVWKTIGPSSINENTKIIGFEDIDGFNKEELYAVGWGGEIWLYDKNTWVQIVSPTSINLTAVCCAPDGIVYVVGHSGIMLRGRRDKWSVTDTNRKENLRDVYFYNGTVYVTTDFRILKLVDDELVNDTDFADSKDHPKTCLHLLSASDGLISLGTKDVFRRSQNPWERLV
ncbi:MAG: hypothetical protein PHO08_12880 [Methylococcales bacterium]|nr:hypothetical protein [Methylococcales bacterium]MDD5632074.1 hypothetical protein [Methylococcales bacterium]